MMKSKEGELDLMVEGESMSIRTFCGDQMERFSLKAYMAMQAECFCVSAAMPSSFNIAFSESCDASHKTCYPLFVS